MMQKVLFLCTGNYYRSRFAEIVFNLIAHEKNLNWKADSRGLTSGSVNNTGPISLYALEALETRGIQIYDQIRFPIQLQEDDLLKANVIIALKEAEHRPLLQNSFPRWVEKVEYWHVHDLDIAPPDESLSLIEMKIGSLVQELTENGTM
jgi:protein-tyrosine phosphatase